MEKRAFIHIRRSLITLLMGGLLIAGAVLEAPAAVTSTSEAEGPLTGRVIAVDAGHGGYDGGARAPNGTWEKVYNLSIALALGDYLRGQGATVVYTRDGDYALCDINPPIRRKRQDMERRAEIVLDAQAELLVSIHMNNYKDRRQSGPQVFFRPDCAAGVHFSQMLQARLIEELTPRTRREALAGDFYITSLGIPSALVECGFLSNAAEEALLRTPVYEEKVARAIGLGIIDWFALAERPEAAEREDR